MRAVEFRPCLNHRHDVRGWHVGECEVVSRGECDDIAFAGGAFRAE